MLHALNALGWLNAIDNSSHLNQEARRLIGAAGKLSQQDYRVKPLLERLRNAAHSSIQPLEKAEILLFCAAIGDWRAWYTQAARDAREAVIAYASDDHRRAVALWILGLTQWEILQNHEAHKNWAEAKRIFQQRQVLFQHFPQECEWYKNRIWQMEVAFVARPEEITCWLNCFERSSLRQPTQEVISCVRDKIRTQAYPNVYALMQDLQEANRRSKEMHEMAEVYLEFGLAVHQMGNKHFAIELLRQSVQNFHPGIGSYHKQVVARCMLGAMEWRQASSRKQAAADWKRCIEEFENLRGWADRDNLEQKVKWYAQHRDLLRAALLEQRSQNPRPLDPDGNIPDEEHQQGPPPGPMENPGDLYQDLLIKVRFDHGIADRLIEFERKKAPAADRDELIRRAIERWIRDNQ
jgi:hypothetical protein